jgi:hypothetical protein
MWTVITSFDNGANLYSLLDPIFILSFNGVPYLNVLTTESSVYYIPYNNFSGASWYKTIDKIAFLKVLFFACVSKTNNDGYNTILYITVFPEDTMLVGLIWSYIDLFPIKVAYVIWQLLYFDSWQRRNTGALWP